MATSRSRSRDVFLSPDTVPPVLSAFRAPGTTLTMEMLSESWIRNARHSRLALDERASCLRTSICETVERRVDGVGGVALAVSFFPYPVNKASIPFSFSPSLFLRFSCADTVSASALCVV